MEKNPYFLYPAVCELRICKDPGRRKELKEFIAVNVGDREALLALISELDMELANFYPQQQSSRVPTEDTIDSFIAKYGATTGLPVESPLIAEIESGGTEKEVGAKISNDSDETSNVKVVTVEPGESYESAMEKVRNLVKNREYGAALAIMESFYLNNPKKSVYFADQIRFVRKLMLNESKKT